MIQDVFAHVENSACMGGPRRCNVSLDDIMAAEIEAAEEGDADVLYSWGEFIRAYRGGNRPKPKSPLCSSCTSLLIQREAALRAELWSELLDMLGL